MADRISMFSAFIALFALMWSIISSSGQNQHWKELHAAQESMISEFSAQTSSLEKTQQVLEAQNEELTKAIAELGKQNEAISIANDTLQNSVNELTRQNEINEQNLDLLLSEKGVQCRIGYLCCKYDSLWPLLEELEQDTLLIVENELTKILNLEYLRTAEPYDYPDSFLELQKSFPAGQQPIIIMLKIDLLSNNTVLTKNISLQMSEVLFPEAIPIALPKLSAYSMTSGIDQLGNPYNIEQYHGKVADKTYNFSDQVVKSSHYTTILCPVMIQGSAAAEDSAELFTACCSTYGFVSIPSAVKFTDQYSKKSISKAIRDLNDSSLITEYKTVIGYG